MHRILLIILSCLGLTACGDSYQEPNLPPSQVAKLDVSYAPGPLFSRKWLAAHLVAIDGQILPFAHSGADLDLAPGPHQLSISVSLNDGSGTLWRGGNCPCDAPMEIPVTLEPGQSYELRAEGNATEVRAWVVDGQGARVSKVVTALTRRTPQDVYVPVVVYN